ncbi:hypothetical protein [Clostridium sp. Marseille-Q2269]|uniref:hypothetical protein n=1 Tax=Clostridium sp. Marseille-Q2269 TaxID=2942205 RepID=UPI002072D48B|nr:hypothetical protein [Clostridium sp. Marseille-Q2269]
MRLIMNSVEFNMYELDSESELREYIRVNEGIIVGNDVQVKKKFYMIEQLTENMKKFIGILNEDHGILPIIVKLKNIDVIVLASDRSIYIINLRKNEIIKNILCDSIIFELMIKENEDKMFILCELGIQCLTTEGDKIWTYNSEVISDFTFYDNYVKLTVEDVDYKISLLNGKVI